MPASVRLEEQRRIGREIHDGTAQMIVVLQLQLRRLKELAPAESRPIVAELDETIIQLRQIIRAMCNR